MSDEIDAAAGGEEDPIEPSTREVMRAALEDCFSEAEAIVAEESPNDLEAALGAEALETISALAVIRHAGRGVVLTLAAYKLASWDQDIRYHKAELPDGFAARDYDTRVTIPFLIEHQLPHNVETHWLTQAFSFAGAYLPDLVIKTVPKRVGPLAIEVVNLIEARKDRAFTRKLIVAMLVELVRIRNAGRVVLTRPKGLSIDAAITLVRSYLSLRFQTNTPRIPQVLIYAIYQCLVESIDRYDTLQLEPLGRMKSADRKAGTVGDIVVSHQGKPVEAVETKLGHRINIGHVSEVMDKVRSESVRRYYILSDAGIEEGDATAIRSAISDFLRQNGCEIIVNGLTATLSYYLRLLPDTAQFLSNFAQLVEDDADLDYEHRIKWNECCKAL
ncbi:hypothetical protein [Novosphingobium sp.]|uniref:hypothetical protein n=1 Tax=Novosphingobium sp. TaxID=1874826 RepID=UPI0026358210|nr:hypothetical protein [Novosphingobium sp.]